MKNEIIIIICLLCIVNISIAGDIELLADIIDRNVKDQETKVFLIDTFIENTIEYEYHYHPKSITTTWRTKKGDCTDKTLIKYYLLKRMEIPVRLVHGYLWDEKHDFYLFKDNNNTWTSFEPYVTQVGYGVW